MSHAQISIGRGGEREFNTFGEFFSSSARMFDFLRREALFESLKRLHERTETPRRGQPLVKQCCNTRTIILTFCETNIKFLKYYSPPLMQLFHNFGRSRTYYPFSVRIVHRLGSPYPINRKGFTKIHRNPAIHGFLKEHS